MKIRNTIILKLVVLVLLIGNSFAQIEVKEVESIGFTVSDINKAVDFYSKVLTFQKISEYEISGDGFEHLEGVFGAKAKVVKMKLGDEVIELTEYSAPKGNPIPVDSKSNDKWFQHIAIVVSDMQKAYDHLIESGVVSSSTEPQTLPKWNKNAADIQAFYFKDPDNHNLEIIYFPSGKGNPKWQMNKEKLFLGIDHTAIVVSNTERSLEFYKDLLGLSIAGGSENYGTEQEHLNNVFGARLKITTLKSESGPGIEFLEYITPAGGRNTSVDVKANDVVHWQVNLSVSDLSDTYHTYKSNYSYFVSNDVINLNDKNSGIKKGILLRDPDLHGVRLIEKFSDENVGFK